MLAPKRPTSVYDHRPVAVQVVKQNGAGAVDKYVLIVESLPSKPGVQPPPTSPKAK